MQMLSKYNKYSVSNAKSTEGSQDTLKQTNKEVGHACPPV